MSYITEHRQKFTELDCHIKNLENMRKQANGGNCILFSYPPGEEGLYIQQARKIYEQNGSFIDVSSLLVSFIGQHGWNKFRKVYECMKTDYHKIFHDEESEEKDLFAMIIDKIKAASDEGKIPFLIRTGSLYGTGIENQQIMENDSIMRLPKPLVIFYPSVLRGDNIEFLGFKTASKYRCALVK